MPSLVTKEPSFTDAAPGRPGASTSMDRKSKAYRTVSLLPDSAHRIQRLNQRSNVAVTESKGLQAVGVVGGHWNVVRHEHIGITDLFVHLNGFYKVDVPFIGIDLQEIIPMAANIAEVHIEDLVARTEIADDIVDLG